MSTVYNVKVGGDCDQCKTPPVKPVSWTRTILKTTAIFSAFAAAVYASYWYGAENASKTCGWAFENAVQDQTAGAIISSDETTETLGNLVAKSVLENTPGINLEIANIFESLKNFSSSFSGEAKNQVIKATAQLTSETWNALPLTAQVTMTGTGAAGGTYALTKAIGFVKTVSYPFVRLFGGYRGMPH